MSMELKTNDVAKQIQKIWLDGDDKQCEELVFNLAKAIDCNPYALYGALTNLEFICYFKEDTDETK